MNYNDRKSAPVDEQATFGNQAPFASSAAPSAPHNHHDPYFPIPTDIPPVYTAAPSPVEAVRNPQTFLPPPPPPSAPPHGGPNAPQQNPYSYNPPAEAPPPGGVSPTSPYHQQQQQQTPYFSPPPPQQQQQQPYYGGGAGPSNYGATSNNNNIPQQQQPPQQGYYYDNNGKPYQPVVTAPLVPRAPHGHGRGRRGGRVDSSDSDSSDDEQHHRRTPNPRRKRRKSGSCCSCCCLTIVFIFLYCWYLMKSFAFPDNSCSNGDDDKISVDTMFVPLVSGLNLNYLATEEVSGNIVVNESDIWDPRGIRIHVIKRASSTKTLDQIVHTLQNVNGTTVSRIHLNDSLNKDEKEKIANKRGCLRADVQITYPRAGSSRPSPQSGSRREGGEGGASARDLGALSLGTISGEISVKFKSTSGAGKEEKHAYSLDSLKVSIVHGDVEMNNLVVVKKTHVEIVNGQVSADLTTAGLVKVDMVNGGIGLNINSAAPHPQANLVLGSGSVGGNGWSPENLDVEANAVNGPVSVTFRNHFHGHFALESRVGSISFVVPEGDKKTTPTSPGGKTEGWVSEDGKEPLSALPRLVVNTAIGNIKVKVQPNNN